MPRRPDRARLSRAKPPEKKNKPLPKSKMVSRLLDQSTVTAMIKGLRAAPKGSFDIVTTGGGETYKVTHFSGTEVFTAIRKGGRGQPYIVRMREDLFTAKVNQ